VTSVDGTSQKYKFMKQVSSDLQSSYPSSDKEVYYCLQDNNYNYLGINNNEEIVLFDYCHEE